jgi:hypothetical protein
VQAAAVAHQKFSHRKTVIRSLDSALIIYVAKRLVVDMIEKEKPA